MTALNMSTGAEKMLWCQNEKERYFERACKI